MRKNDAGANRASHAAKLMRQASAVVRASQNRRVLAPGITPTDVRRTYPERKCAAEATTLPIPSAIVRAAAIPARSITDAAHIAVAAVNAQPQT